MEHGSSGASAETGQQWTTAQQEAAGGGGPLILRRSAQPRQTPVNKRPAKCRNHHCTQTPPSLRLEQPEESFKFILQLPSHVLSKLSHARTAVLPQTWILALASLVRQWEGTKDCIAPTTKDSYCTNRNSFTSSSKAQSPQGFSLRLPFIWHASRLHHELFKASISVYTSSPVFVKHRSTAGLPRARARRGSLISQHLLIYTRRLPAYST